MVRHLLGIGVATSVLLAACTPGQSAAKSTPSTSPPTPPSGAVVPTPVPGDGLVYTPLSAKRIADTRPGSGYWGAGQGLGPGAEIALPVTGSGLAPATAGAVVLVVTAVGGTSTSYLTVYPYGSGRPNTSNLNWTPGDMVPNLVTVRVGGGGQVNIFNAAGSVDVIADLVGYYAAPTDSTGAGNYVPLQPFRLLDTRESYPIGPGASAPVKVGGTAVPPAAEAVVLNVTARNPTSRSYLTVVPGTLACRAASSVPCLVTWNLVWAPGTVVGSLVIAPLGRGSDGSPGWISFFNLAGSVDLTVDVEGWYADASFPASVGSTFTPLDPCRALHETANSVQNPLKLAPDSCGIPQGALAVVVTITVREPTSAGDLDIAPLSPSWSQRSEPQCGEALSAIQPTSDVTWSPGKAVANLVQTGLNPEGTIKVGFSISPYVTGFSSDFDFDVNGYFSSGLMTPHQLCIGVHRSGAEQSQQPNVLPPTGEVSVAAFDLASGEAVADDQVTFNVSPMPGSTQCGRAGVTDSSAVTAPLATTHYRLAGPSVCLITARDRSGASASSSVLFGLLTLTSARSGSNVVVTATYLRTDGTAHSGVTLDFRADRMDSLSDGTIVKGQCVSDRYGHCRFSYSFSGASSAVVTDPAGLLEGVFVSI